jgi:uncharacterized protein YjbJ (UPF0337 family)
VTDKIKPVTDKIFGGMEKAAGKLTSNADLYERGERRAAGDSIQKN